ncbi:MAG: BamA/TamA family outer membrane protein [Myxococcota bacterium]|nr:BamA/TamA family outer membrane protein [Myxococcota bacterium]
MSAARLSRVPLGVSAAIFACSACSKIPPGRSAIDAVRVLHAKQISAGDVEESLGTQASTKFLFLFQGLAYDYSVYDEAVLQRDMARVERFYQSKGFFDAQARVAHVYQVKKDHVRIEIVVDEGRATLNRYITVVGLDGLPKDVADVVTSTAKRAVGGEKARFDEEKFKNAENAVKKALTDRGYAYATVESDAELDVGEHVVDYGFKVVPGIPAVFGPITITGLDPDGAGPRPQEIPEAPLRRAINIKDGSPYSTAEIDSATQALLDLGVFSAVDISPTLAKPPPQDHVVPLTVRVEPTRLRAITLGGGLELDQIKTDLHVIGKWEDHNFLGGLRDFSATFKPGVVLYPLRIDNFNGPIKPLPEEWLKLELRQPGFLEARTTGFIRPEFNVFPLLVQTQDTTDRPVIGYRELKLPIGADRTFLKRLYVALDYTFQVESPFAYVHVADQALTTVTLSFPELVTRLDFRDDPVRPHEGVLVGATFSMAGGPFGGSANDVRVQPEVRTYVPLSRGLTFATRASVGFLWASNYARDWNTELTNSASTSTGAGGTPARQQLERDTQIMYFRGFFSGGPSTNRGFPLLQVAPHGVVPFLNPSNSSQSALLCNPTQPNFNLAVAESQCFLPVGGFTLWELQNDVRFDISGPLSASVFCDMSDVSPHEADIRLSHLHLACGVGAAYDTPVGPIRADLAYRLPPLQVLGYSNEELAADADPVNGRIPHLLGLPIALAVGIGQAF